MSVRAHLLCLAAAAALSPWLVRAAAPDPFDQSGVPLEKQPTDPKLAKIVLVAGRASHGPGDHEFFAGSALLMKMLQQTPGVFPVLARDGWPKNYKTFENAKAVVFYMDGGSGHPIIEKGHKENVLFPPRQEGRLREPPLRRRIPQEPERPRPLLAGRLLPRPASRPTPTGTAKFATFPKHADHARRQAVRDQATSGTSTCDSSPSPRA